ncbi:MAG: hypothetical protein ING59_08820 [Burkholderiales bacterium]|nr:hypothetical protein [Burkholderiales bacterium]
MSTASRKADRSVEDKSKPAGKGRLTVIEATLEVRWPGPPPVEGWMAAATARMMPGDGAQRVHLLLGELQQRLDFDAAGVTLVHMEPVGSVFWDRATKSYAQLPLELRPRTKVRPSRGLTIERMSSNAQAEQSAGKRRNASSTGLDGTTVRIDVDDDAVRRLMIELDFSPDVEMAPFGRGLLRALYCGPGCHRDSGLPWDELDALGLPVAARMHDVEGRLVGGWSLVQPKKVSRLASDFAPPAGYKPLEERLRKPPRAPVGPTQKDAPGVPTVTVAPFAPEADEPRRQGLDGTAMRNRIRDVLTPDCLGSTRLGTMSATLHQDLFTVMGTTANMMVPLVGNTVVGGGSWSIPWMANMAATVGAAPAAPGAGLFTLLRNPRVVNSGVMSGGDGLIDRLAWGRLSERDGAGLTRTEREFAAGTLAATLARWGVGAPADAELLRNEGRIDGLTLDERVMVVEGFETAEIGTLTVALPPPLLAPVQVGSTVIAGLTTPPLFTVTVAALTGTADFTTLPGGVLVTSANIGSNGNVIVGLNLPDVALTATLLRLPTVFGGLLLGLGTIAMCLLFPLFCPLVAVLATLAAFVLTHLTMVRALTTGVNVTLDVSFRFDPNSERVEPFVTVASRTGTTVVSTTAVSTNPIAAFVDAFVAAIGNAVDGWGALLADQVAKAVEAQMRQEGLHFPIAGRQNELRAVDGLATSQPNTLLELQAELAPPQGIAVTPYATQVPRAAVLTDQLARLHVQMRGDLNPQPAVPAPGPGPALTVGTFAGLALSQNALNQYLFSQWLQGRYEVTVTDPHLVSAFWRSTPTHHRPQRVHLWAATPPRAELAMDSLAWARLSERDAAGLTRTDREFAAGTLAATLSRWGIGAPLDAKILAASGRITALTNSEAALVEEAARRAPTLVVFFDDVRVCFEASARPVEAGRPPSGTTELAFNFSTHGRLDLGWPFVFAVVLEQTPSPLTLEPATWEFVDRINPRVMSGVRPSDLENVAALAARMLVGPHSRSILPPVASVPTWNPPLLSAQQALVPIPSLPPLRDNAIYVEVLAHRKAAYLLPAVYTQILQLVDGSGAPDLPWWLGIAGAPQPFATSALGMTAAQGAALRGLLGRALPLPGP